MRQIVPWDEDILGFCTECIRVRWLRIITENKNGNPKGLCRSCAREKGDTD